MTDRSTINVGFVERSWVSGVRMAALTEQKTLRKFCLDAIESARARVMVPTVEPVAVPVGVVESPAVAKLSEALAKPRPKVGEKCPHGWANWLQCEKCR